MRRHVLLIAAGAALVAAAVAAADSIGTRAVKPVTATFTATNVLKSTTRTCTGPGGPISATSLDVTGTSSSSEAAFNGPVRIRLDSVVDTAKQLGTAQGSLRVTVPGGPDTITRLVGVVSAGKLNGLVQGSAARPFQRVLGNLSAAVSTSGLTGGKIGATDAGGGALLAQPGKCRSQAADKVVATGAVSALTDTSITVAATTCSMSEQQRRRIGNAVQLGTRVQMTCRLKDGKLELEKLARA